MNMNWFKKIILSISFIGCMQNTAQPMGIVKKSLIGVGVVAGAAVVIGGASVASSYIFPFRFPKPTGQFGVGTEIHYLDNSEYVSKLVQPRNLTVQFWYPTEHKAAQANYPWAQGFVADIKKMTKFAYLFGMDNVFTHAQPDAPLAEVVEFYPIILYSHGMGSGLGDNASLCEELASKGYIVVGIGHPQEEMRKIIFSTPPYPEFKKLIRQETELWVAEAQSVLDYIEKLSAETSSKFFGKLDLEKIGMVGHSLGGATAVQLCRRDHRCKAVVDLDGNLFGKESAKAINKPVMFILANETKEIPEKVQIAFFQTKENFQDMMQSYLPAINSFMTAQGHDVYKITINGANHMSFCDQDIIKYHNPIIKFSAWCRGGLSGYRRHDIMKAYVSAFFDKYFKNEDSALLIEQSSAFAEVETQFLI